MQLSLIRTGDTIEVNIRGRIFEAVTTEIDTKDGVVHFEPPKGIYYHNCTSRQVQKITKKVPRRRGKKS